MFLLLWMGSALSRACETWRQAFPQLVLSERCQDPMFWYLLPAPVIEGRVYRRPSMSTDQWLDKEKEETVFR